MARGEPTVGQRSVVASIVEYALPTRFDGRKQSLRPYRGSDPASESDQEYRHHRQTKLATRSAVSTLHCNVY
jgi:hypothetical protein